MFAGLAVGAIVTVGAAVPVGAAVTVGPALVGRLMAVGGGAAPGIGVGEEARTVCPGVVRAATIARTPAPATAEAVTARVILVTLRIA